MPKDGMRITTLSVQDEIAVIEVCADIKNITGRGTEAECTIEFWREGKNDSGGSTTCGFPAKHNRNNQSTNTSVKA